MNLLERKITWHAGEVALLLHRCQHRRRRLTGGGSVGGVAGRRRHQRRRGALQNSQLRSHALDPATRYPIGVITGKALQLLLATSRLRANRHQTFAKLAPFDFLNTTKIKIRSFEAPSSPATSGGPRWWLQRRGLQRERRERGTCFEASQDKGGKCNFEFVEEVFNQGWEANPGQIRYNPNRPRVQRWESLMCSESAGA